MFPRGNAGIARLMMKTLIPGVHFWGSYDRSGLQRTRKLFSSRPSVLGGTRSVKFDRCLAQHDGDPEKSEFVSLIYTLGNKVFRVKARTVVMAGGCWTTKHIVRDLPAAQREAYNQFYRSPCLMANVELVTGGLFTKWESAVFAGLKVLATTPR
ncbi:MAG: dependent oxidoreductase [Acidobacteriaceae bacterium]|nr:dependent oxidoreductase [Acidobacteriaceae bacterium]